MFLRRGETVHLLQHYVIAALNLREIAKDDKLKDLLAISGKIESEGQGIWQPSLVKSSVNVSGNVPIRVIFNGFDHRERQLIVDDLASGPVSDSRASPELAKLVIHQCVDGKGFRNPFKVEGIDRSHEGRNGRRERGCLRCKGSSGCLR